MLKNYYTNNLYPFQDLVLKLIMEVDDTFYLTGGTALGRHYLKHRYSDDLDFFVNWENAINTIVHSGGHGALGILK
jgi:predicted nucleotidyltransferase component of viral defense system